MKWKQFIILFQVYIDKMNVFYFNTSVSMNMFIHTMQFIITGTYALNTRYFHKIEICITWEWKK